MAKKRMYQLLLVKSGGPEDNVLHRGPNYVRYPILARIHKVPLVILFRICLFCYMSSIFGRILYKLLLGARLLGLITHGTA